MAMSGTLATIGLSSIVATAITLFTRKLQSVKVAAWFSVLMPTYQARGSDMEDKCKWQIDDKRFPDSGDYGTDCLNVFSFPDGTPEENGFNYCPFCGKEIFSGNSATFKL